jgi:septum formation protein
MTALILTSASESRRRTLAAAGVSFEAQAPHLDEPGVKKSHAAEGTRPDTMAMALAELKALRISGRHPDALVLGRDQLLVCDGWTFDKAENLEAAVGVLRALRGKRHDLVSAAVLTRNEAVAWRHIETTSLWMRDFSDVFLDGYLVDEDMDILSAVGCYRIEARGAQLFARVMGDQFAIRGVPLIPLLHGLREHGVLTS